MGGMVSFLRSVVFLVVMFVWFPLFTGSIALTRWYPQKRRYAITCKWNFRVTLPIFERILGIRYRVIGRENLPQTPSVILSKHQSAWETLSYFAIFPSVAYVLKRELLRIPFFGWGLAQMPIVSIDRKAGKDALRQVVDKGCELLREGFWVVIFPEGTRTMVGSRKRYKSGGALLATAAGVAVVPVAHNAGEFWPRQAFIKRAGVITVSIGPAILTQGRSAEEVNAEAEAWIEGEMLRLFPHHYADGIGAVADSVQVIR
jgi:1-acyl-sn-glycerol-3-phosphate acyltransferase